MFDDDVIGNLLISSGLQTPSQVRELQSLARGMRLSMYEQAVRSGAVDEKRLVEMVAGHLDLSHVALRAIELDPEVAMLIPAAMARQYGALPIGALEDETGATLYVAMKDPTDVDTMEIVGEHTRMAVVPVLAGPADLDEAIARVYARTATISGFGSGPRGAVSGFGRPGQISGSFATTGNSISSINSVSGSRKQDDSSLEEALGDLFEQPASSMLSVLDVLEPTSYRAERPTAPTPRVEPAPSGPQTRRTAVMEPVHSPRTPAGSSTSTSTRPTSSTRTDDVGPGAGSPRKTVPTPAFGGRPEPAPLGFQRPAVAPRPGAGSRPTSSANDTIHNADTGMLVRALARTLVRKGLVTEAELLAELTREG